MYIYIYIHTYIHTYIGASLYSPYSSYSPHSVTNQCYVLLRRLQPKLRV